MEADIKKYYDAVCQAYSLGNVETSYNAPIIGLLKAAGCQPQDMSGSRKGKAGENTDIELWRSGDDLDTTPAFAAVEVKRIGGIDARAKEQVKKAAGLYGNAILTDNARWEFWHKGAEKCYTVIPLIERADSNLSLKRENIELFASLLQDFLLRDPAQISSSKELAVYMAKHAQTIRSVIKGVLKDDSTGQPLLDERQKTLPMFAELYGLYVKIKEDLRSQLSARDFADMYAQTIVYGLFIARYNDKAQGKFDKYEAIGKLQKESALLNRFFTHIASTGNLHPTLDAVIGKLCDLYAICDISALLDNDARADTIVHFYESFLAHYDPVQRKERGVFYTPHPVVRFLISIADEFLTKDFGIEGGISCNERLHITVPTERQTKGKKVQDTKEISIPRVAVLDPACGTGTFHAQIIKYIKEKYFSGARQAFYNDYIQSETGLLSRLIGFEIMMTSYAVAHLNIRRAVAETLGQQPETNTPASVYLTNTLSAPLSELEKNEQLGLFDFSAAISEEAYQADTWKARRPVKVIIGNPPYLAASTMPYDISAYKLETDGVTKLQERKHWLNDDYVKFFRFAEQVINRNNEGILAYVSNNGYLDNPTFRGMRASLLRTFDKIYIVNLHGSAVKQEKTPDGGKDENIFAIMQGVSLFVGVKTTQNKEWAKVYYADVWGPREEKFAQLENGAVEYTELQLDTKMAYFMPIGGKEKEEYEKGVSLAELFPVNVTGIVSGRDESAITNTREELARRIDIVKNATDEKPILEIFKKFARGQSAKKIQDDVLSGGIITQIAYRPFDNRWTYYSGNSCGWIFWPREKNTMGHLLQEPTTPIGQNIGFCYTRSDKSLNDWAMVFVTDTITESCILTTQTSGIAYIAPLYLSHDGEWMPNLNAAQLRKLTQNLSEQPSPIAVFDYCYGVLYDPVYRETYGEYLKRDFPRVPQPANDAVFRAYAQAGECLRRLHLLQEKATLNLSLAPGTGANLEIGTVKYAGGVGAEGVGTEGALQINSSTTITGIPPEVWAYRIGGYQVLDKWFSSHKGEKLTLESFTHIANVAGLLAQTIQVQEEMRYCMHKG